MFFLIVDAHAKWFEVYPMKVTPTKKTIECLRDSFARFGLPRVLVGDNVSLHHMDFRDLCKTSAPFKPSNNGQAERYVVTSKHSLRAVKKFEGTIQQKLSTFLLQYRKAHNLTTILSPAILFLKREIRTRIDLLLPGMKTKIQYKLRKDNFEFRDRKFDVGDRDDLLHYILDVLGTLVRRYADQIPSVGDQVQENIILIIHQRFPPTGVRENNTTIHHAETAEDNSKDLNKELVSSSVPSTDVPVPDQSISSREAIS
ncbi:uncharacterized protein K02A2.6 [Trichonephila inaurata madagascariensis]|uniref:Uncharacterized protein K02A2.6 n=1 Tax=Trichonephila inaurata madagascariensis TaxID=2747483 RepID=A0A8X7C0R1_9ARAC|nr:uncharacterized protein K02A2.6 [Trichonephila inaurata madagascariensis]